MSNNNTKTMEPAHLDNQQKYYVCIVKSSDTCYDNKKILVATNVKSIKKQLKYNLFKWMGVSYPFQNKELTKEYNQFFDETENLPCGFEFQRLCKQIRNIHPFYVPKMHFYLDEFICNDGSCLTFDFGDILHSMSNFENESDYSDFSEEENEQEDFDDWTMLVKKIKNYF